MKPEKNLKFSLLYRSTVGIGLAVIGYSLYRVIHDHTAGSWMILALFASIVGSFSLKIPGMNGRVSAGDTITCLSILLFGPYAGVLSASVDAMTGSFRCKSSAKRLQFSLYNGANSAIAALMAGHATLALLGRPMFRHQTEFNVSNLVLPLCIMAAGYYLLNTILVAAAVAAEKSLSFIDTWRNGFMWTCVNYLAGAFVAGMLAQVRDPFTPTKLMIIAVSCLAAYISCNAHVRLAQK
jgi:uncharacterized membrane protein